MTPGLSPSMSNGRRLAWGKIEEDTALRKEKSLEGGIAGQG